MGSDHNDLMFYHEQGALESRLVGRLIAITQLYSREEPLGCNRWDATAGLSLISRFRRDIASIMN